MRHQSTNPVLQNILFLDIETVHGMQSYYDLDQSMQDLWSKKASQIRKRSDETQLMSDAEVYIDKAGMYSEFGKIIVISVGRVDEKGIIHLNSYSGDDEEVLLQDFKKLLDTHYASPKHYLCGHNAREFDIPYLCRRMKVYGITLPTILPTYLQKPRDSKILDTMEMWKFGDRKSYTSLDLLCNILTIDSPKSDITGSDVSRVYRESKQLKRIQEYCERDVRALIEVYKRLF